MDGIKASEKMMMGHKMELFLIVLSFIGWALLSVITLGLAYFYVIPYMHTTMAVYYEELKKTTVIGEQQAETSEDTVIV